MPRVTITVPERNAQPYRFQLERKLVTLGRGADNDIAIDNGSVSVKHAEMRRVEGGYELRDMGSTNGLKLDDERYQAIPLRNGMSVKLGDVAFGFLLTDEEMELLAHEKSNDVGPVIYAPEKVLPKLPPLPEMDEQQQREPRPMAGNRGIGGYGVALLVLLAIVAFGAGMAARFRKETGGSLIDAIKARHQTMNTRAGTAPELPATSPDAGGPQQ